MGNDRHQGICGVWVGQKRTDGEEQLANGQGGRPLVLENVKANSASLVDVGVVDLGRKDNIRGLEWIVWGKLDLQKVHATLKWTVRRTHDGGIPYVDVLGTRTCTAVCRRVALEVIEFLGDTLCRHGKGDH